MTSAVVNVKVLFFAKARELSGVNAVEKFEVPIAITVSDLLDRVASAYNLARIKPNLIVALNEVYCDNPLEQLQLTEGDELAIIPPISGG